MSKLILPAALLAVLLCPAEVLARDYGQRGTVFPVIERDLLEQIHSRLTQMESSGETARLNEDLKRRTIARVNRPDPVAGIVRASEARRWHFDPTITLAADIRGAKGELIHAAGTRVNPLDSVGLRADLLFLDGDDPDQLTWALKQAANAKLILVKGAPLELMKAGQRRFYFDQGGKLTARFGIRSVPARVRQQGRLLEVSEIALPPKRRTAQ
ncbi:MULTISPECIES: type-F conjugative transfer system protein TraW [Sphingomonadales]|uniref:Conjugal transfer pilus assembly protein TraW n=1 Tax=Sphingopyxis indica TaxID=436663 RepID=A0A239KYB2_9SPHN|nr:MULTISPECIES: type-F conjugative transfer system protein TraW [Sphingomonadales]WPZ07182.1 type-F conjugative transfer system protein TraW [Pelagerythrobacter marinus]SNT22489.1 conjugal transfer pilus assembly protein TraW [Sphingopyxis indica]